VNTKAACLFFSHRVRKTSQFNRYLCKAPRYMGCSKVQTSNVVHKDKSNQSKNMMKIGEKVLTEVLKKVLAITKCSFFLNFMHLTLILLFSMVSGQVKKCFCGIQIKTLQEKSPDNLF